MKKDQIIYWVSTSIVSLMMLMSGIMYFANPEVAAGFIKMGFQDYFRIELGIAKIIAAFVLMIPMIPTRIKEWAYAGLGITLISAGIAHGAMNDFGGIVAPAVILVILSVSYYYLIKVRAVRV